MFFLQYFKKRFITPPPTSTNILITYQAGSPFNTFLNFTLSNTNGTITNNIDYLSYYHPTYLDTTLQTNTSTNFTINNITPTTYLYSTVLLSSYYNGCIAIVDGLGVPGTQLCEVYERSYYIINDITFTYYGITHNYLGSNTVAPSALPITYTLPDTTYYIYIQLNLSSHNEIETICYECIPD